MHYFYFSTMLNYKNITCFVIVIYIFYTILCGKEIYAENLTKSVELDMSVETDKPNAVDVYKEEAGFSLNAEDMRKFHIWPSGIIPYFIDFVSFDKVLRDRIRLSLDNINSLTGLRFLEIPSPPIDKKSRWVMFLNRIGQLDCVDHPFKNFTDKGIQRVVLGYDCISTVGGMSAVLLTLVGVPPQHNAPNRDENIIVKEENILPDKLYLFEKLKDNEWLFHDLHYDFQSAGHYGYHKYTANGGATIMSKIQPRMPGRQNLIGGHKGLSDTDVLKIKMLYNYISRNREIPSDVHECSKLFEAGNKLADTAILKAKHYVKPRKKPFKYLGEKKKGDNISDREVNSQDEEREKEEINIKNSDEFNKHRDKNENLSDNNFNNDDGGNKKNNNKEIKNDEKEVNKEISHEKQEIKDSKLKEEIKLNTDKDEEMDIENKKGKVTLTNDSSKHEVDEEPAENVFRNRSRVPLKLKIMSNKAKFLGKSDYETGDEDDKKFKHE